MDRERAGWLAGAVAGLIVITSVALWAQLLVSPEPFSTPIRLVDDSLPAPADAAALPGAATEPPARLGFVGDIMQHRRQAEDDFSASYAAIAPLLRAFDLTVGNLEFPVDTTQPVGPPPRSTRFNGSPAHLDALAAAGFDVLSTANNHSFDGGEAGLVATLAELERRGIRPIGTARSLEELARPAVVQVGGVRIALRAYTRLLNVANDSTGEPDWPPRDLAIHALDFEHWETEQRVHGRALFASHVAADRAAGAEFAVAIVHWGNEWYLRPTADQRRAAGDLIDAGFDLVVGSHSHVLAPLELRDGRLIAYSLGNLISDFRPLAARTGGILAVELGRSADGAIVISDFGVVPVVVEAPGHVTRAIGPGGAGDRASAWKFATRLFGAALQAP